jgi:acyl carrier protein phosphodiesterase
MNFLGHIFLTPDDDDLLLGNFIADSVKGDPNKSYSGRVAEGIRFHRAIDAFTDSHPLVKQGVGRFRATQGRYAAVVIDVVYDHILASNWGDFHAEPLDGFTHSVLQRLEARQAEFPERVRQYFPYMKLQNWLYNYRSELGLLKSLQGLDRRSAAQTEMHRALDVYLVNQEVFLEEFEHFIADAQRMASDYF